MDSIFDVSCHLYLDSPIPYFDRKIGQIESPDPDEVKVWIDEQMSKINIGGQYKFKFLEDGEEYSLKIKDVFFTIKYDNYYFRFFPYSESLTIDDILTQMMTGGNQKRKQSWLKLYNLIKTAEHKLYNAKCQLIVLPIKIKEKDRFYTPRLLGTFSKLETNDLEEIKVWIDECLRNINVGGEWVYGEKEGVSPGTDKYYLENNPYKILDVQFAFETNLNGETHINTYMPSQGNDLDAILNEVQEATQGPQIPWEEKLKRNLQRNRLGKAHYNNLIKNSELNKIDYIIDFYANDVLLSEFPSANQDDIRVWVDEKLAAVSLNGQVSNYISEELLKERKQKNYRNISRRELKSKIKRLEFYIWVRDLNKLDLDGSPAMIWSETFDPSKKESLDDLLKKLDRHVIKYFKDIKDPNFEYYTGLSDEKGDVNNLLSKKDAGVQISLAAEKEPETLSATLRSLRSLRKTQPDKIKDFLRAFQAAFEEGVENQIEEDLEQVALMQAKQVCKIEKEASSKYLPDIFNKHKQFIVRVFGVVRQTGKHHLLDSIEVTHKDDIQIYIDKVLSDVFIGKILPNGEEILNIKISIFCLVGGHAYYFDYYPFYDKINLSKELDKIEEKSEFEYKLNKKANFKKQYVDRLPPDVIEAKFRLDIDCDPGFEEVLIDTKYFKDSNFIIPWVDECLRNTNIGGKFEKDGKLCKIEFVTFTFYKFDINAGYIKNLYYTPNFKHARALDEILKELDSYSIKEIPNLASDLPPRLFKKAQSVIQMGQPDLAGKGIAEIIKFLTQRISGPTKSQTLGKLRDKIWNLDEREIASKKSPATASLGQSITFIKTVLQGHSPEYIRSVLASTVKYLY